MQQTQTHAAGSDSLSSIQDSANSEFLAFRLGKEEYGIDILKVQEIRGYDAITKIANAPEFIKGMVNLRGVIVPIVDMRIKFNLGEVHYDQFTVVIILNLSGRVVGIVVDSVSDVINLEMEQVHATPEFGAAVDTEYIMGLGTVEDRMLVLIDIEKLMSRQDMGLLETDS
ncbi:chemotaxis protein CheW [Nitrosomonas mobilis]|uniref:Chemotaxis protein CheW n=1 Tax=Nitrosomonas mobilis TaxID=51642 RepID=A0A1G5SHJ9_9PROT|nr:chemotaxis protein CheW [Nitrosomonas mobilis]SCZ86031.1 purine-binding chemotaxis protein [Nitrosomonas mobilis]HNO75319.1 chemotaxis protein CheW [Nitrosomonas mobilis]